MRMSTSRPPNYQRLLRAIQDELGGNQEELAKRLEVKQPTISRWLNNKQKPERESHERIVSEARKLGIIKIADTGNLPGVTIVGYVGAGGETHLFAEGQGPFGEAGMPPKGADELTVAVVVRGDSMTGQADDGWLIYYRDRRDPPTTDLFGKLCVVGLRDGRVLVKKLYQGRKPGMFDLHSVNSPVLLDQPVEWAAKVTWIEPQ